MRAPATGHPTEARRGQTCSSSDCASSGAHTSCASSLARGSYPDQWGQDQRAVSVLDERAALCPRRSTAHPDLSVLVPHRNWARPAQASAGEAPKWRRSRVGQDDLVRISRECFSNNDLIRPTTREEDYVEVNSFVAFDGQPSPCEIHTRDVAADLVPKDRARVAAALGRRLLCDQPHRGDLIAARAGLGEFAKRSIGAGARPVHDKRM
jgi:hypothetical protein